MTCIATMASSTKFVKEKRRRRHNSGPAHALKASLRQAAAQRRLTVGLHSCVNILKRSPEKVMACLLLGTPVSKDHVGSNIQHTLLKAYCTEHRINVVHVNADMALMRLVARLAGRKQEDGEEADCSLILIEHPDGAPSPEDVTWAAAGQGGYLDIRATGQMSSD